MTFNEYMNKWQSTFSQKCDYSNQGCLHHIANVTAMSGTKANLIKLRSYLSLLDNDELAKSMSEHIDAIINKEFKNEFKLTYSRRKGDYSAAAVFMGHVSFAVFRLNKEYLRKITA